MSEIFRFSLLGLGAGGLYALAAIGLVLVYRGSGVVNFAQAALGLAGAYAYYDVKVRWHAPTPAAMVAGIAVSAALGAAFHLTVMRRMRRASTLAKIVATLALLVILQGAADLRYGFLPKLVPSMLPVGPVYIFGTAVGADRIWIFGIVVTLTTLLWAIYRFTSFGVATSAVAENPTAAAALSVSPDLVAAVNWAVGGGLAGIAVVLLVPITGLGSDNITLLVIPVLAAAAVGRFSSFPLTTLAGLAIGVGQSLVTYYVEWPGWGTALPFLLVTVVLVARGSGSTDRNSRPDRLPALGSGRIRIDGVLIAVAAALAGAWILSPSWQAAMQLQVIYAIILLSLILVTGYAGQVSLAQMAFAGLGGMGAEWLTVHQHWSFGPALLGGAVLTAPVGVMIGLLASRTKGVNFAIVTLGFAISLEAIVYGNPSFLRPFVGASGQNLEVFGVNVSPSTHPAAYTTLALVVLVIAGLCLANVRRGRAGRRLIAVRTNERAAAAMGISAPIARLYALGLGAAIAGLGGALLTFQQQPYPNFEFPALDSITAMQNTVIGGIGSLAGAPIGATFQPGTLSQHFFSFAGSDVVTITSVLAAVGVLLILTLAPEGLAMILGRYVPSPYRRWGRPRIPGAAPSAPWSHTGRGHKRRAVPTTLEVSGLTVRFGGVVAVSGFSMDVRPGEVVGLIGPNGAGKSTVIDAITGFVSPTAGSILVGRHSVRRWSPRRRARNGLARSFQALELFDDLTVRENLLAACDPRDLRSYATDLVWPGSARLTAEAAAAVEEFGLTATLESPIAELTHTERRAVAVSRAAARGQPILLLDEPGAGLDAGQTRRLGDSIRRMVAERDLAVLLVEHNIDMVMRTCDRIYVLDFGQLIAHGTPEQIRSDPLVAQAYLGALRSTSPPVPRSPVS